MRSKPSKAKNGVSLVLALYQPDIPQNTGTLLRLGACLGVPVHVIGPVGFRLDDPALKRAGMDYLERAALTRHSSFEAFDRWLELEQRRLLLMTTKSSRPYCDIAFEQNDVLLMGRESVGVPEVIHQRADERLVIPMIDGNRSLNVAVATAMVLGEALRQTRWSLA